MLKKGAKKKKWLLEPHTVRKHTTEFSPQNHIAWTIGSIIFWAPVIVTHTKQHLPKTVKNSLSTLAGLGFNFRGINRLGQRGWFMHHALPLKRGVISAPKQEKGTPWEREGSAARIARRRRTLSMSPSAREGRCWTAACGETSLPLRFVPPTRHCQIIDYLLLFIYLLLLF